MKNNINIKYNINMASFDNIIIKIFTYINNKNKQKKKTDVFLEEGYLVNCLGTVPYFF